MDRAAGSDVVDRARSAWLALLNTQLRAAEKHAAAAELQLRLGRPAAAEMERRRVAAKRVAFQAALERHPEWVGLAPAWPAVPSLDPGEPVE